MPSNEQINAERAYRDDENKRIKDYRSYVLGFQKPMLTEAQWETLGGRCDWERSDNIWHQITSEHADRAELTGFNVEEGAPGKAQLDDFINNLWVKNALADLSGEQSYNTIRDGNAAVMVRWIPNRVPPLKPVGPDYGRILITLEPWWDGNEGVWIYTEEGNESESYAVKEVVTYPEGRGRSELVRRLRYVYYHDRIEKFVSLGDTSVAGWEAYEGDGDIGGIQLWTKLDGTPLHIPIIHFPNAGRMWREQGVSIMSGGGVAQQNDLNLLDASHVAAAIMTAYQRMGMRGYTPVPDPLTPGQYLKPPVTAEPGAYDADASKDFMTWVLPAGSVEQILKSKSEKVADICRATRTPKHSITGGDWPSGEALNRAERPAVDAANRRINKWSPRWATVIHRAVEMANVFGKANLQEDSLIVASYADPSRPDPLFEIEVQQAGLDLERSRESLTVDRIAAKTSGDIAARLAGSGNAGK